MKKLLILFVLVAHQLSGQPAKPSRSFEIEIDPIAYMMNGYSVHGIYHRKHLRFDLGVYGIEQPEFAHGNEGFTVLTQGFGLKVNYLFKDVKGLFVGADAGYASNRATFDETGEKDTGHNISVGVHTGFRFFPFMKSEGFAQGLYISPWAGIGYNLTHDKIKFAFKEFRETPMSFFPTIHIGYRFVKK